MIRANRPTEQMDIGGRAVESLFEQLRVRREARETEERQQVEARREAERREEETCRAQLNAAAPCDEVVMRVLTQLQQAAYPASQVRNHRTAQDKLRDRLRGRPAWSIGHTDVYWATDSLQEQAWYTDVVVRLEFDDNNHPVSFSCCRVPGFCVRTWFGHKFVEPHVRCGLSERDLVQTLNQLYPAHELDGQN